MGEMLLSVSRVRVTCCRLGNGRGSVWGGSCSWDDLASGRRGVALGSARIPISFHNKEGRKHWQWRTHESSPKPYTGVQLCCHQPFQHAYAHWYAWVVDGRSSRVNCARWDESFALLHLNYAGSEALICSVKQPSSQTIQAT